MAARSRRGNRRMVSMVIVVAVAALSVWLRQREEEARDGGHPAPGGGTAPGPIARDGEYHVFPRARLVEERSNDGDSFRLRLEDGDERTLRLYFVDAPEKYRHPRGYNVDRLASQSRYFGGIGEEAAIEIGLRAREFTVERLARGGFQVFTRGEPVYDSDRVYGFVRFTEGPDAGAWLSELLVAAGLARIHTKGADLPDGTPRERWEARLRSLEDEARGRGAGAWGLRGGQ